MGIILPQFPTKGHSNCKRNYLGPLTFNNIEMNAEYKKKYIMYNVKTQVAWCPSVLMQFRQ